MLGVHPLRLLSGSFPALLLAAAAVLGYVSPAAGQVRGELSDQTPLEAAGDLAAAGAWKLGSAGGVMLIPCAVSREADCRGYFRGMMRYVRTFTLGYRIRGIRRMGDLQWLLLDFAGDVRCGALIRAFRDDLSATGAVLEDGACGGRHCEKLFNLNHRLMLVCAGSLPDPAPGDRQGSSR